MKSLRNVLGFLVCICFLSAVVANAGERLAVPDEAAQKPALAAVKEVFRQDLAAAKTASHQSDLAKRMLNSLEEKPEAATANYVLLTQAQGLAVKALNTELTRQAIDELAKRYEVDPLSLRATAIRDLGKGPTDAKLHGNLAQLALGLVDDCVEQERFDIAVTAVDIANSLAIRAKSNDLRKQSTARKAEIAEIQKLWDESRKGLEVLKTSPQDPAANDAVGRYLIAVKSDWNQGLVHWVLSSDKDIQKAAKQDSDVISALGPSNRDLSLALGDSWWDVAAKQSSPALKAAMKLRAGQWYGSVLPGLEGLTKARVDQRLTDSRWQNDPNLLKHMPRSRTWEKLNPRFMAAEGWFNGKFALCQAASLEEAMSLNQVLTLWQFRPIRFRPYRTPNGLKVAAIWHKSPIESEISHGTQYQIRQREEELRQKGFFPSDVASYFNETGEEEFTVVWAKTKPAGATDAILVLSHKTGETMEQQTAAALPVAVHHFWTSKKEPVDSQVRTIPGSPHGHVWGSRGAIQKAIAETKIVCVDISLSSLGNESDLNKLLWAATFHPRENVQFVEVHKPNLTGNRSEWRKLADEGYAPVAIGAVSLSTGATVSSTIWHRSTK